MSSKTTQSQVPHMSSIIRAIGVKGYKSIRNDQSIEIRPLTLLAGANSSGKSSIMQAVLLLKQTLDATYDPGPLLLNGPNAKFSQASQMFFKSDDHKSRQFRISVDLDDLRYVMFFSNTRSSSLNLERMDLVIENQALHLHAGMLPDKIEQILTVFSDDDPARLTSEQSPENNFRGMIRFSLQFLKRLGFQEPLTVERNRCFFNIGPNISLTLLRHDEITNAVRSIIHVPGLRGNPARDYPISAVGETFPGTFENYTASVIAAWQNEGLEGRKQLNKITQELRLLGLTGQIEARKVDDTKVELQVGRTLKAVSKSSRDRNLVNVADVGFGVSQALPVLVALSVARPGQLVYLEQPEIHLHPRAQIALAQILADAAIRGVQIVAETHSSLLLTGVQTLVANGTLPADLVKLHWFTRDDDGETHITSADLDENGAFGDWPEDFDEVTLRSEGAYLDAIDLRTFEAQAP